MSEPIAFESAEIARQLQMLGELAELGLEQARALDRHIKRTDPPPTLDELQTASLAYARVSRAVRIAILLQSELIAIRDGEDEEDSASDPRTRAQRRKEHAATAVDVVKRVANKTLGHDPFTANLVVQEARYRLERDDLYGDVLNRPIGELVALICRDLKLRPDWVALSQEAWAKAEAASGAKGSPFVAAAPEPEPPPDPAAARREVMRRWRRRHAAADTS